MKTSMKSALVVVGGALLLAGCAVEPYDDYAYGYGPGPAYSYYDYPDYYAYDYAPPVVGLGFGYEYGDHWGRHEWREHERHEHEHG